MASHKASIAKEASSPTAAKCKSTLNARQRKPMFRSANPELVIRGWEKWEDQLVLTLHKEGQSGKQISQRLPGRTERACRDRWLTLLKAPGQIVSTQQEDTHPSSAPPKQYWHKKWEDWEDRIVITHCNVGKSYEYISKMLPPRTKHAVRRRWKFYLEPEARDIVNRQTKSLAYWKQWENQALKDFVESGRSWAEITKRLPSRSEKSCRVHWSHMVHKAKGTSTGKTTPRWQEWEERLLVSGYYAGLSWEEIAERVPGRTRRGARAHWIRHFHTSDQNEPWTSEELALLACPRWEGNSWDEITKHFPGHSYNACRTQWYKEKEGIQGPSSHRGSYDVWSEAEVEILIALYNTIGPRWQEICKHIHGRTEIACESRFRKCTMEDGVGGPPSKFWIEFFMNEPGPGGASSEPMEAASDSRVRDEVSTLRLTGNQQPSVDARKTKVIDVPMV